MAEGRGAATFFLSSTFTEMVGAEEAPHPLRREIREGAARFAMKIWAYEDEHPEKDPTPEEILDRCYRGIEASDLFVFLLARRHGSGLTLETGEASLASYLEMELLLAILLKKPILILHEREAEPHPRMLDAITVLAEELGAVRYRSGDRKTLIADLVDATRSFRAGGVFDTADQTRLLDHLARHRSAATRAEEVARPKLVFLQGDAPPGGDEARPEVARALLASAQKEDEGPVPHGVALFRIWASMRELVGRDGAAMRDPERAPLWDQCLERWNKNAAWFGLHGHVGLGALAAVQSRIAMREGDAATILPEEARDPRQFRGARASALYSIAQRLATRAEQREQYRKVVDLVSEIIAEGGRDTTGPRLIRCHTEIRLAALGRPWRMFSALDDAKTALAERQRAGATPHAIGEAMGSYGFCLTALKRHKTGLKMIEDGLDMMRADDSAIGRSFRARSVKMLEKAAEIAGDPARKERAAAERRGLAASAGARDQMRPL